MAKIFYTERDIEDMLQRGVTSMEVTDEVVLTDLAREMAIKHGIRLVKSSKTHLEDNDDAVLIHRVKAAVLARVGGQVDIRLLDAVVTRVIKGMK